MLHGIQTLIGLNELAFTFHFTHNAYIPCAAMQGKLQCQQMQGQRGLSGNAMPPTAAAVLYIC